MFHRREFAVFLLFLLSTVAAKVGANSPIVIIHGAWGGAHHWKTVGDRLTHEHGRLVRRASLTGLGERSHLVSKDVNLSMHIQDVVNLIEFDDLSSVILIAHSYGGAVATGVVDAIPSRIKKVIFIDSHLIDDGECYFTFHKTAQEKAQKRADEDGGGWLIPVDWENKFRDTPHPIATLIEPLSLKNPLPSSISCHYWLLADGKPATQDDRHRYLERAIDRGWTTQTFSWNHNPQRDRPDELVEALVKVLD